MSHLVFTLDYHELVRGKLETGKRCNIEYDPLRIIPVNSGYTHGDPAYTFTAHLQFLPSNTNEYIQLYSPAGIVEAPVIKPDGSGSIFTGEFTIPDSVCEIAVWFSVKYPNGQIFYDSKFGSNYHFRFTEKDFKIDFAEILSNTEAVDAVFRFQATSVTDVQAAIVRYKITNSADPNKEFSISLTPKKDNDHITWTIDNLSLPNDAVVAFDVNYFVAGRRYKIDNNGNYMLATTYGLIV